MSFLKKLAKGVAQGVAQGTTNNVRNSIAQNLFNQGGPGQAPPQQAQPHHQQPMQPPQQPIHHAPPPPPQPAQPPQPSILEGAFAGLLGSAERFIDNANKLLGACQKCQAPVAANTNCQECGTLAPPLPGQDGAQSGPRSCNNCGAPMQGNVCEYCAI